MNVLTRELRACLSRLTAGDTADSSALFTLPPEFSGFKGHFPGNPILPGVCMVQAVLVMLAEQKRRPVTLKRIVSAKWFAPVKPGAQLLFKCHEREDTLVERAVRVHVTCGEAKVADLSLLVNCGAAGKEAVT